jgi:hypothetical protein
MISISQEKIHPPMPQTRDGISMSNGWSQGWAIRIKNVPIAATVARLYDLHFLSWRSMFAVRMSAAQWRAN